MNFSESDYGQNARNNENRSILFHNLHEHQELHDITNMCRICASISGQVCPIFDEQCDDLAGKINKYLPIEVSCEDGLPQVICEQCQSTLVAWDELVKCCVQANGVLQQKLSVIRLLDPDKKKQEERAKSIESPTQNGQTLICVKIENESIDKTTELDKLCNQKESIDKPRKTVTKDGKRYGVCDICNKNIAIASWSRHSQSHSSVKRYSCHICGLGFNDSGNLSRHRRAVHAHQRPHACNICDRSFSRNSHLKEHIKTHSENRDYICDVCGKASKSSAALRMHRKTHASEYRFRCIYCESKFKRRSELVIHVSVHTGEKSHVCGCGKAFRLRNQLRNHTRTHIKEIQSITQQLE